MTKAFSSPRRKTLKALSAVVVSALASACAGKRPEDLLPSGGRIDRQEIKEGVESFWGAETSPSARGRARTSPLAKNYQTILPDAEPDAVLGNTSAIRLEDPTKPAVQIWDVQMDSPQKTITLIVENNRYDLRTYDAKYAYILKYQKNAKGILESLGGTAYAHSGGKVGDVTKAGPEVRNGLQEIQKAEALIRSGAAPRLAQDDRFAVIPVGLGVRYGRLTRNAFSTLYAKTDKNRLSVKMTLDAWELPPLTLPNLPLGDNSTLPGNTDSFVNNVFSNAANAAWKKITDHLSIDQRRTVQQGLVDYAIKETHVLLGNARYREKLEYDRDNVPMHLRISEIPRDQFTHDWLDMTANGPTLKAAGCILGKTARLESPASPTRTTAKTIGRRDAFKKVLGLA